MSAIVSRTDLARNTREIVDQVRNGQTVTVESHGQAQIVLLDALDYRILNALAKAAVSGQAELSTGTIERVLYDYSREHISLAKSAELLGISRFDLMARFERLDIPLRIGPATLEEARDEVQAASGE